jgi:hypothetical protein
MGMKDRSFIDKINPKVIALTATAIDCCLLVSNAGKFSIPPVIGPGGVA